MAFHEFVPEMELYTHIYRYLTAASILLALLAAPPGQTLGSQYFLRVFFFLGGPRQRRLAIYYSTDASPCTERLEPLTISQPENYNRDPSPGKYRCANWQ